MKRLLTILFSVLMVVTITTCIYMYGEEEKFDPMKYIENVQIALKWKNKNSFSNIWQKDEYWVYNGELDVRISAYEERGLTGEVGDHFTITVDNQEEWIESTGEITLLPPPQFVKSLVYYKYEIQSGSGDILGWLKEIVGFFQKLGLSAKTASEYLFDIIGNWQKLLPWNATVPIDETQYNEIWGYNNA